VVVSDNAREETFMSKMIDIAQLHRVSQHEGNMTNFLRSKPIQQAVAFLVDAGVDEASIMRVQKPARGSPGIIKVHPLLALEYLRWADYSAYAGQIVKRFGGDAT